MTPTTVTAPVVAVVLGVSPTELSIRMGVGLAVTLTLLTALSALVRRRGTRGRTDRPIVICHQQQLTKHTTLSLIQTGSQQLLIATNPETTTLLATGPTLTTTNNNTGTNTGTGGGSTRGREIDIRNKPNPLKQLQNKTTRRA